MNFLAIFFSLALTFLSMATVSAYDKDSAIAALKAVIEEYRSKDEFIDISFAKNINGEQFGVMYSRHGYYAFRLASIFNNNSDLLTSENAYEVENGSFSCEQNEFGQTVYCSNYTFVFVDFPSGEEKYFLPISIDAMEPEGILQAVEIARRLLNRY